MSDVNKSTLYLVSTPIGNLEDITLRALNVLKSVDVIACEDTRHSLKLLNHYEIKKQLIAYHSYNENRSCKGIIKLLETGKSIALITDGGTPCISDPGYLIVNECIKNNIEVISIPGAAAFTTLLTSSGFRADKFYFQGFLSPKSGKRQKALKEMSSIKGTLIIYESPHRLLKSVEDIFKIFPKNIICIGKELTKINETVITGNYEEIMEKLNLIKIAGEFVILIANY